MKPDITFLRKVADGEVYPYAAYSPSRGRYDMFKGGKVSAERHALAGFVSIAWPRHTLDKGSVILTESGRSALATETPKICLTR